MIVMSNNENEKEEEKKVDIKTLVSVIPPASALKGSKAPPKEKRVKIRKRNDVDKGFAIISSKLAKDLGITNDVEISVKGKRIKLKAILQEEILELEVWANPQDLVTLGIEDNSTVTVRASK
ncbi:hypothetical protein [Saccharolobus islandicus]|jgi:anaerobic selenocysteine-containing dehydrogenase|uniref:Uncharacterized protein n=10 Tax=Saccharolobus islandicus TaxID=43080 RepID=M9UA68_SACIS|nr:hypothetical protein [Sulfolobus islandicus]AGJ62997.1 Hypothetical Protein SiL_1551 [Sulfolobus islandicus LAL14/1]WCM38226.1 hypothetical protein GO599_12730 [Sulfolobus islandicus]